MDGSNTERCQKISDAFNKAGYPVWIFKDVISWLKSHMIIIMPLMGLLHLAGWKQKSVIQDTKNIKLAIRAFKEMVRIFKDLNIPVYPKKFILFSILPGFILVPLMKKGLASKTAEIGIFGHAKSACGQSEMKSLAFEFTELLKRSSIPTPSWDKMLKCIKQEK